AGKARTDPDPGKTLFGDRGVDDAARPEFLQETLADLVGALVLGDFLAHQEPRLVAAHLLGDRIAQRLAHGNHGGGAFVLGLVGGRWRGGGGRWRRRGARLGRNRGRRCRLGLSRGRCFWRGGGG